MAKITRTEHIVFGNGGPTGDFAQFGSLVAGSALNTKDLDSIQALPAWSNGFQDAVYPSNKAILLEDLNAFCYEHSTQVAYLLQEGIPEWIATTTYEKNMVVKLPLTIGGSAGVPQIFASIIDSNLNNQPPVGADNANWRWINRPYAADGGLTDTFIPVASIVGGVTSLIPSSISEESLSMAFAKQIKFPDGSLQSVAAQPITIASDVTASRAFGVVYQNASGKVMHVSVGTFQPSTAGTTYAYSDSASPPTRLVSIQSSASTSNRSNFFIVMPGDYYKVSVDSGGTILTWIEWT